MVRLQFLNFSFPSSGLDPGWSLSFAWLQIFFNLFFLSLSLSFSHGHMYHFFEFPCLHSSDSSRRYHLQDYPEHASFRSSSQLAFVTSILRPIPSTCVLFQSVFTVSFRLTITIIILIIILKPVSGTHNF